MNKTESKLVLELRAANAKFQKDIDEANRKLVQHGQIAEQQSKRVAQGFKEMDVAARKANHSIGKSSNTMNAFGMQMQDVIVQAQAGTSPFTILAQQGSQLASVFGPTGALIGGVIALGAAMGGILWRAMDSAAVEADELRKELDKLYETTERAKMIALRDQINSQENALKNLRAEARGAGEDMRRFGEAAQSPILRDTNMKGYMKALEEFADITEQIQRGEATLAKLKGKPEPGVPQSLEDQRKYYADLWKLEKDGQAFIDDLVKEALDGREKMEKEAADQRMKALKQAEQERQKLIQSVEQIRGSGLSDTAKENELYANNIAILDDYRKQGLGTHQQYNALVESETKRHNATIYQINSKAYQEQYEAERDANELIGDMVKDALKVHEDYVKEREQILLQYDPATQERKRHQALIDSIRSANNERLMSDVSANAMLEQEALRHQKALSEIRQQGLADQGKAFDALMEQYKYNAENWSAAIENIRANMTEGLVNGVADALAQAIVQGESLRDTLENIGKAVLTEVVSSFIKLGIQMLINKAMGSAIQAASVAEAIATAPLIAAAYAPAAAMASLATLGSNAIAAQAGISSTVALASGLALTGMAHDGIASVPREGTWLLDKGERVLSADHNERFVKAMEGEGGRGNGVTVNNVFNISPGIEGAVRSEIIKVVPALEKMAVRAVESAIRGGGSTARAVGVRR